MKKFLNLTSTKTFLLFILWMFLIHLNHPLLANELTYNLSSNEEFEFLKRIHIEDEIPTIKPCFENAEQCSNDIFQLNCNGDILDIDSFNLVDDYFGFQLMTKDGILYLGDNSEDEVQAFDLCTGDLLRNMSMNRAGIPTCTTPIVSAFAIQPSCVDNVVQSDGYLQLSSVTNGDRYHWSEGSVFDDMSGINDYTNATDISGATYPLQFNTGLSNSDAGDFTIRVFNGASDCFTDVVVALNVQDCTIGCDCKDYIFLNDIYFRNR